MGIYDREYYRDESGGGWLSGTAPVCKALIATNVAVWLAIKIFTRLPILEYLAASSTDIFQGWGAYQLLTAAFVHQQLFHILINMVVLWVFGREVESLYGSRDFLGMYLVAAVFSTLIWALIDRFGPGGGSGLMLGASGAVMAIFTIYAMYYPRREVLLMFILPVPIWLLLVLFIGMDLLMLLQEVQGESGRAEVAFASHLGGAAFGYLFKTFDLRLSRLLSLLRLKRSGLRVYPPSAGRTRPAKSAWLSDREPTATAAPRVSATVTAPVEGDLDERLDEILAKIATQGRNALSEEENRILQEASRRAKARRGGHY